MLKQTAAVTRMNLESLGSRAGSSATVVVGSAAVIAVLLGLLAMSAGFRSALVETAKADRGLILLVDRRFSQEQYRELFPAHWSRPDRTRGADRIRQAAGGFWSRTD